MKWALYLCVRACVRACVRVRRTVRGHGLPLDRELVPVPELPQVFRLLYRCPVTLDNLVLGAAFIKISKKNRIRRDPSEQDPCGHAPCRLRSRCSATGSCQTVTNTASIEQEYHDRHRPFPLGPSRSCSWNLRFPSCLLAALPLSRGRLRSPFHLPWTRWMMTFEFEGHLPRHPRFLLAAAV
jgi:hypothetical protein